MLGVPESRDETLQGRRACQPAGDSRHTRHRGGEMPRPLCTRRRLRYFFGVGFGPHPQPHALAAGVATSAFAFSPRIAGLRPASGLDAMAAASFLR